MIDEIFKVMKHFNGSYINSCSKNGKEFVSIRETRGVGEGE